MPVPFLFYRSHIGDFRRHKTFTIMNKTMLVLSGRQNTGKTQTLRALIGRLCQSPQFKYGKDESDYDALDSNGKDCRAVFTTTAPSGRAVKVAVLTAGDTPDLLTKNLSTCRDADIIVCACRAKNGSPVWKACKEFAKDGGYTPICLGHFHIWHYVRDNKFPMQELLPAFNGHNADALLDAVLHIIDNLNAKEE